ncbi:ATP-dependent zinc metalloprotease FtsH [Schlesneria sp. T3-172]|uniref:ATP-dependent zinc metalloprotease FtsH n=1 Tax=Schlesneria sphaerica TaxID=3373610 RepID=UPI0037C779E6
MSKPEPKRPTNLPEPSGKRPDKGNSSNLFWFLMILAVIGAVLFSFSSRWRGKSLTYSEFVKRLEDRTLHAGNVFELRRGHSTITFQDLPKSSPNPKHGPQQYSVSVGSMSDAEKARLDDLLRESNITDWGYDDPPSPYRDLGYLALFTGVCLLCVWLVFRRIGGPGSAIAFGRSRGKLFAQEEIGITFNDVAGIDEAVEELREIVDFLRNPGRYQALGGRIPRGVLLVGPPGTGKTLLAKAVAGEAGVPFYGLSGSDFVELFVGVGAARVRDMFQQAGQRSPAIIFIDELDAIGKVRSHGAPGGGEERDQTLNALLVEMDGFGSDQSVIVLGATNRPETLDPALMRPGRFDRHILVDRPDIRGREAILKVHAAKVKMDDGVNLKHLAKLTAGFVGADLANLVNEAALLAARKNKTSVTTVEFDEGFDRVVAGLEKTARVMPEEVKQRVAWHEVGHALVACSLPNVDPVHKVSIIPRGLGALGYTLQRPEDDRQLITRTELQNRICVLLGGIAAEEIVYHENSTGASNDLQRATDLARRMITEFGMSEKLGRVHYSESRSNPFLSGSSAPADYSHSGETIREIDLEVRRIIDAAYETAHEILVSRRTVMEHITRELLEKEVIDQPQLEAILDQYKTGPQLKPGTFVHPAPPPLRPTDEQSGQDDVAQSG